MPDLTDLENKLRAAVEAAAAKGWQPADVRRVLRRVGPKRAADAVDHLHGGFARWPAAARFGPQALAADVMRAVLLIELLPPLGAPGGADAVGIGGAVDGRLLERVRALLAKAESTHFPAEAEALTAKAHELMARHAINEALLAGGGDTYDVVMRRVFIEDPYARMRFQLLGVVARACGCRAVMWRGLGFAVLFGFPTDIEAAHLLYASLLLQAMAALAAAREPAGADRARKAAFRRSFLLAFAVRVGIRLAESSERSVSDLRAEHGDSVLPVLASRDAAVDAAVERAAPGARALRASASDGHGWLAGAAAGDRATFSNQPAMPAMPRQLGSG